MCARTLGRRHRLRSSRGTRGRRPQAASPADSLTRQPQIRAGDNAGAVRHAGPAGEHDRATAIVSGDYGDPTTSRSVPPTAAMRNRHNPSGTEPLRASGACESFGVRRTLNRSGRGTPPVTHPRPDPSASPVAGPPADLRPRSAQEVRSLLAPLPSPDWVICAVRLSGRWCPRGRARPGMPRSPLSGCPVAGTAPGQSRRLRHPASTCGALRDTTRHPLGPRRRGALRASGRGTLALGQCGGARRLVNGRPGARTLGERDARPSVTPRP